jgi:hypothetical protein
MPVPRIVVADEEDRRLRAAEPFARTYLNAALRFAIELCEAQDLAPEPRQHLGVAALEHELTDAACHRRNLLSARELPGWPQANLRGSLQ